MRPHFHHDHHLVRLEQPDYSFTTQPTSSNNFSLNMDFKHSKLGFLPAGSLALGSLVFFFVVVRPAVQPAMGMLRPAVDVLTLQHVKDALKQITSSPDPPATTLKATLGNLEPRPQHTPVPLPYQGLSKAQAGPDRASQHSLQPEPSPIAMLESAVPEPDPSVATSSESPAPVLYRVKLQCSDGYVTLSKPPKSRKIGTFCEGLE